jgi:hypothetical protein
LDTIQQLKAELGIQKRLLGKLVTEPSPLRALTEEATALARALATAQWQLQALRRRQEPKIVAHRLLLTRAAEAWHHLLQTTADRHLAQNHQAQALAALMQRQQENICSQLALLRAESHPTAIAPASKVVLRAPQHPK